LPPLPALPASDAEARLHRAFARLVRALATSEHPLLLFLDDLQWADAPSLRLLEQLMGADEDQALLVIGAFRDNEVSDDHPLRALQMALAPTQRVDELFLGPLDASAVTTLVAETLRLPAADVQPLAALCLSKTGGNPFFLVQFLRQLHEDGALRYERAQGRWHWDLEAIAARGITDNVVELMLGSLQRLPASTQRRLAQAAQLGEAFGHAELMHSADLGAQDLALQLWPALQAGLLQALNEDYRFAETPERLVLARYRFLHDRVQQAAHELTPASERPALLLQLARRLGDISDPVQREARLFTRLDCLNAAEALLQSPAERAELLQLNLQGAAKARASSAHALAVQLLRQALALQQAAELPAELPAEQRLALYRDLAESSYLAGEFEAAERLYPQARAACPAPLDQAQLLVVQADQFHIQGRFGEAFEVLREALALLGAPFPADEAEAQALFPGEFAAALQALLAIEPLSAPNEANPDRDPGAALLQAPPMQAPEALLQMRLMYALTYSTYQSGRLAGFLLDACRLMRLTLDQGQSDLSPVACLAFMTALSVAQRPYAECHALGRVASRLAEARGNAYVRATGYQYFNAFYQHWGEPLAATLAPMDQGLQLGLEGVNPLSAGYCALLRCVNRFVLGTPLAELQTEAERSWKYLQSSQQPATAAMLRHGVLQPLAALRGASLAPNRFDSAAFEGSDALLAQDGPPGIPWALASAAMLRHALLFDDEAAWRRCSGRLQAIGMVLPDSPSWVDARFFIALGQLRWDGDSAEAQALRAPFEAWALSTPCNYRAHQLLLSAEQARVRGEERAAMDLYARAIEAAAEQGWPLLEALGNELYAAFWMQTQQPQLAKQFLREAYHHYRAWGASAKCRQLEARWPQQIVHAALRGLGESSSLASAPATHSGLDATPLDLRSLVKAQQALASEVHLDGLLRQMFAVLLENAGAQRGAIVLLDEGRWRVETLGAWQGEALESQRLSRPLADCADLLPLPLLEYVQLTRQTLVLNQPGADARFAHSPYLQRHPVRSALCLPLLHQGQLLALVYLEHAQLDHAFPAARRQMLELLGTQAAISLLNARLVEDLEAKVAQRTDALRRLSMRDGLTGVANRRAFDESLVIEWRRSQRSGQPLSLLMIDIDHFKQYNDHYGHIEGDRCIQLVAQLLQRSAERAGDCVARYGGEEFAMLLPATGLDAALALARDCQAALAAQALPHARSDTAPVLTLSMGLACLQADEGGPERLLRAADEALYRAKRGGRNRVVCAG
ncbi:MAG: diguanylate cyclase, partial [Burkholderiales bacterium]|nr:diguanylate cyclase [Burkholderiales bacterium]